MINDNVEYKARLVVRGFEDESKVQNDSATSTKSSLRVFFATTSNYKWKCETVDVKATFLQGKRIERDVFVMSPFEVKEDGVIWKLEKVVYGLDASTNWHFSVTEESLNIGCEQSKLGRPMIKWYEDGKLQGLFLMHVDDFLYAGSQNCRKRVVHKIMQNYEIGKHQGGNFKYVGIEFIQTAEGIKVQQNLYIDGVEEMSISRKRATKKYPALKYVKIRSLRALTGQLNWVAREIRPDVRCSGFEYEVTKISYCRRSSHSKQNCKEIES